MNAPYLALSNPRMKSIANASFLKFMGLSAKSVALYAR
jgi:hypothetical protein